MKENGAEKEPKVMSDREASDVLETKHAGRAMARLYGDEREVVAAQVSRYGRLVAEHVERFGMPGEGLRLFSAPGRVEVGGNHTDHNHGRVLAAAINLDAIATACRDAGSVATVYSEGYGKPFVIELADLDKKESERGTTFSLVRGICRAFRDRGYQLGGFDACVSSDVAVGSGLSSSAAFEVLIATTLSCLYNDSGIPAKEIALMGQYAENEYFGKPSGLMDQMTSAVGGLVIIDFKSPRSPSVRKVDFDFDSCGFDVVVVNTGGSHADLTEHYSSVAQEMNAVAAALGRRVLRDTTTERLMKSMKALRGKVGDRAILRALHFFADNERVQQQVHALEKGDFERFLRLVNESGQSSWMLLQNVNSPEWPAEQGLALAQALTDRILRGKGAWRVHGGGFAGTILTFVARELTTEYAAKMDSVFGDGAARALRIRAQGAGEVLAGN